MDNDAAHSANNKNTPQPQLAKITGLGYLTLIVAVAYAVTGYIGFALAIPPGNVSILWLPSGIAMAAVLMRGYQAIPGILLGAIVINIQSFYNGSLDSLPLTTILAILMISVGNALPPLIGRHLLRRFGNVLNPFDSGQSILQSSLIFAAACTVSASVGTLSLSLAGLVDRSPYELFGTWWLGDFIGALSFTPLILSVVRQSRFVALSLIAVAMVFFGGTYVISNHVRTQAIEAWDNQASREAERLTTTLISWLETASSPVNSISAVLKGSEKIIEQEFFDAVTQLEDYQPDFFPRTLGIAAQTFGANVTDWEVVFSTDHNGPLSPGAIIADGDLGRRALIASRAEPGRLIIGEFGKLAGESVTISSVALETGGVEKVVFGVLNLKQMFDGLFAVQVPPGFHLHVLGAASGDNPENLVPIYGHGHGAEQILDTKTIRGTAGNAQFTFQWDITDLYLPGSREEFANALLIGGILGSAALLLFFSFVLGQNEQIRRRVDERTSELSQQTSILESTMESMDQGLTMFDQDFKLTARNSEFMRMLDLPFNLFPVGTHLSEIFRYNAKRGEYGDGDIETLVQERLDLAAKFEPHRFERTLANGKTIEIRGNPLADMSGFVTTYSDISDRKKAEQEIADKEALLRMALENMPGGIAMIDADMKIQVFNDTYRELYGHAPGSYGVGTHIGDVIRMNVEKGIHRTGDHITKDVDETVLRRIAAFRTGKAGESERELADGRILNIRHNPLANGGVVLVATDITARRKAEAAIARQEAQIRAILESVPDAVVTINPEGTIQTVNKAAETVFGYNSGEMIGKDIKVLMPEEFATHHDKYLGNYLKSGEARFIGKGPSELSGQRKSGVIFPLDISIAEAVSDNERIFVGVLRDITARKESERVIAEKEAQLRAIINNIPIMIILKDRHGRHLTVNNYYEVATGISPDAVLGKRDDEFMPSGIAQEIMAMDRKIMASGELHTFEESVPNPDGTMHSYLTKKVPVFDENGNVDTLVVAALDITELKQTERELAQKEAMLTAALENMTGGLFMIDVDMKLRVFNERFSEFYNFPREILKINAPLADVLRVRADRGDYGEGDPEQLVAQRLDGYRNRDVQIVIDYIDDRIIEVYRAPMADGGMVCVFNDVTERKQAEEALTQAHTLITESLSYASRIQRSLLPPKTILEEVFDSHAMIWEPKDMVGGDMVWLRPAKQGVYLIVADCTGHGPPGAFMTMICTGALDQALSEMDESDPAQVLSQMNRKIKSSLGQDGKEGESDDGVELGICHIDSKQKIITFAGARFSLVVVEDKNLEEIKGSRSSLGYRHVPVDIQFDNHAFEYNADMQFYMWSDGLVDQIGGPKRRSFGKRRLHKIVLDYHKMDLSWQKSQIMREFEDYQHDEARRDDVTFFGFIPR